MPQRDPLAAIADDLSDYRRRAGSITTTGSACGGRVLRDFVPLVGATVAGVSAGLVAFVFNGFVTALIVVAVVVAVNQVEDDILAPVVLGQALALHPLAILLALSAGTVVAGVVGAAGPAVLAWTVMKTFREPGPGRECRRGESTT